MSFLYTTLTFQLNLGQPKFQHLSASEKALPPVLVAFPSDAVLRCWILLPKEAITSLKESTT
jgi:hypothetical protein